MKFSIGKVSSNNNNSPCKNAYTEDVHRWKSDISFKRYYVDINTLEELMELIKEVGESIVIDENMITIYDDYLE